MRQTFSTLAVLAAAATLLTTRPASATTCPDSTEALCAAASGECAISGTHAVGRNCVLDFHSRSVTLTGVLASDVFWLSVTTLGASAGSGPTDCSQGAGPGTHCVKSDTMASCSTDGDCGGAKDACV
jgi:hypothetical protein